MHGWLIRCLVTIVTPQHMTKVSLLFGISGNYTFSVLLVVETDASTPEYAAAGDMSRKHSKRRPDVKANTTAAANDTEYANVRQRQVEIPATSDTAATNNRLEAHENPEYYNHLQTNVAITPTGDLDTEMTENDVYERGDDLEQGGNELYSLQQPVTDSVILPPNLDVEQGHDDAGDTDDAADDTDDIQMQENDVYES